MKKVFKEFLNSPREWHAFGAGFILTYIGVFHQPLSSFSGYDVLMPTALGIGLILLGIEVEKIREMCNKFVLPKRVNIPEDIRKEWQYYWLGIFLVFALKHIFNFFF